MDIEQLRFIARAVREIGGSCPDVTLCVDHEPRTVDALIAIGGYAQKHIYRGGFPAPIMIYSSRLEVDGVAFHAQWSRPASAVEIEQARQETAARAESHGDGDLKG